jgi:hypothetical protein
MNDRLPLPRPRVPTEVAFFILAFAVAPLICEKYALEIGVVLTYALIKFWHYFKARRK